MYHQKRKTCFSIDFSMLFLIILWFVHFYLNDNCLFESMDTFIFFFFFSSFEYITYVVLALVVCFS